MTAAVYRRTHCGSFSVYGYMGVNDDHFTNAYLRSSGDGSSCPDVIEISIDMFSPLVRAVAVRCAISPLPPESSFEAVVSAVVERMISGDQFLPFKLGDAVVRVGMDLPSGTINFYIGDRLVGETTGWTS